MLQEAFSLLLPILSFVLSLSSVSTAYSNVYVQCSQANFTSMTPYESNVNSLFASLVDSASLYNFNKIETASQTNGVYGLFQCRGDLSSPNCKECVASSISQLKTTCSLSIGGEIQLDGCFVKYNDSSFFGDQDKMEVFRRCGPSIGYNSDVLNRIDGALAYLVGGNGQYFRAGEFGSIEGVAQCVQDLSLSDCQECLIEASGRLRSECETSTWGDMYLGKCYIRYADQRNQNRVNNGNSASSKSGRSYNDIVKWIGYIIGALGVGVGGTVAVNIACNSCNNTNNVYNRTINNFQKDVDEAKENAKTAKNAAEEANERAKKAEKKAVERDSKKKAEEFTPYYPYVPSMPPPYAYHPYSRDPNPCYYL